MLYKTVEFSFFEIWIIQEVLTVVFLVHQSSENSQSNPNTYIARNKYGAGRYINIVGIN